MHVVSAGGWCPPIDRRSGCTAGLSRAFTVDAQRAAVTVQAAAWCRQLCGVTHQPDGEEMVAETQRRACQIHLLRQQLALLPVPAVIATAGCVVARGRRCSPGGIQQDKLEGT